MDDVYLHSNTGPQQSSPDDVWLFPNSEITQSHSGTASGITYSTGTAGGVKGTTFPLKVGAYPVTEPIRHDLYAEQLRRDSLTLESLAILWEAHEITEDEFLTLAVTL